MQGSADPAAEGARDLALAAFAAIAEQPELLAALLAASGVGPSGLAQAARRPEFAAFVLDFVADSDERLLAVAGALGVAPEALAAAQRRLSPEAW